MKMRRAFFFALCVAITITFTSAINPVDEAENADEKGVARPIRASSASGQIIRKRGRTRHRSAGRSPGVLKRRLPSSSFRPTRAPLFEASPTDPFLEQGAVGPTGVHHHYGHSHSPPTADPYYSPSKYEKERKRQRIKSVRDGIPLPLEPISHNAYEPETTPVTTRNFSKRPKNYAFAYAVGDEEEDFSHKQAKDGPLTIGEYRITLPDGRTQVVRYTAGTNSGYKADVTYEPPSGTSNTNIHPLQSHRHNNNQYHQPVQPTHHFASTPSPTFNSNRVYKSRPLKTTKLLNNHHADLVEYSPALHSNIEHEEEPLYRTRAPKIRLKGGNVIPRVPASPVPTVAEFLNGVSPTPTPRPNSIYDKISPYRGGAPTYSGSDELAYAHEQSPRAGPVRGKKSKHIPSVSTTAATYFNSPSISPTPIRTHKLNVHPTKKYKDPAAVYHTGSLHHVHHQPEANHVNEYIRPHKHVQYLQETPAHHHQHLTEVVSKPVKESVHHVTPLNHYKTTAPLQVSYSPVTVSKPKKLKKTKQIHGIRQPLNQYIVQTPITAPSPQVTSFQTSSIGHLPKEPFHYYNSFHQSHHHGYQVPPSPSPVTSVRHSESPFPNAYPVTAYPSGGGAVVQSPPRIQLPSPPSTAGHVYLETPASGERPNRLGIKETLARLPGVSEFPPAKTTIHPYEVGAADYGKSVAYGNSNPHGRDFSSGHLTGFDEDIQQHEVDQGDPNNSIFTSFSSPSGTGNSNVQGTGNGYFPEDVAQQFNFLTSDQFDVEQANVREIRQDIPRKRRGRNSATSVRHQRGPDKRRGVPAPTTSSEETRPPTRTRQRQTSVTSSTSTSKSSAPNSRLSSPQQQQSTKTTRVRGRRRRLRTQQSNDPSRQTVQSRRSRTRSRDDSS